jgi:hypothetical protein
MKGCDEMKEVLCEALASDLGRDLWMTEFMEVTSTKAHAQWDLNNLDWMHKDVEE